MEEELDCLEEERLSQLACFRQDYSDFYQSFRAGSKGFHELLDRTGLLLNQWDQYVLNHPAAVADRDLYEAADKALRVLHGFYQRVEVYEKQHSKKG